MSTVFLVRYTRQGASVGEAYVLEGYGFHDVSCKGDSLQCLCEGGMLVFVATILFRELRFHSYGLFFVHAFWGCLSTALCMFRVVFTSLYLGPGNSFKFVGSGHDFHSYLTSYRYARALCRAVAKYFRFSLSYRRFLRHFRVFLHDLGFHLHVLRHKVQDVASLHVPSYLLY